MTDIEQSDLIQNFITKTLEENKLYTYEVIYTSCLGSSYDLGLLSITMYNLDDRKQVADFLGCNKLCDNNGYIIANNTTILLTGMALRNILLKLGLEWEF